MNRINKLIAHIFTFSICVYSLYNLDCLTPFYCCAVAWCVIYAVEIPHVSWDMVIHHIIAIAISGCAVVGYMYVDQTTYITTLSYVKMVQLSDIFYSIYILTQNTYSSLAFMCVFLYARYNMYCLSLHFMKEWRHLFIPFNALQLYWSFLLLSKAYTTISNKICAQPILKLSYSTKLLFCRTKSDDDPRHEFAVKVRVLWHNFLNSLQKKQTILFTSLQHTHMVDIAVNLGFTVEYVKTNADWSIDLEDFEHQLRLCKPTIVLVTHMFFRIDDDVMRRIRELVKTENTYLVEDCAQIPFCYYESRESDLYMFSFGSMKQLATGCSGAVGVFNNAELQTKYREQSSGMKPNCLWSEISQFALHQFKCFAWNNFYWVLSCFKISQKQIYNSMRTKDVNLINTNKKPNKLLLHLLRVMVYNNVKPQHKINCDKIVVYDTTNAFHTTRYTETIYMYPYVNDNMSYPNSVTSDVNTSSIITLEPNKITEFYMKKYCYIYL
jgi:hypothetical protein